MNSYMIQYFTVSAVLLQWILGFPIWWTIFELLTNMAKILDPRSMILIAIMYFGSMKSKVEWQ